MNSEGEQVYKSLQKLTHFRVVNFFRRRGHRTLIQLSRWYAWRTQRTFTNHQSHYVYEHDGDICQQICGHVLVAAFYITTVKCESLAHVQENGAISYLSITDGRSLLVRAVGFTHMPGASPGFSFGIRIGGCVFHSRRFRQNSIGEPLIRVFSEFSE